jgi:hypothetical protein
MVTSLLYLRQDEPPAMDSDREAYDGPAEEVDGKQAREAAVTDPTWSSNGSSRITPPGTVRRRNRQGAGMEVGHMDSFHSARNRQQQPGASRIVWWWADSPIFSMKKVWHPCGCQTRGADPGNWIGQFPGDTT